MWARVKSVFLNLWLDQGLTGCHVKWTLATLHRTKKQRFQFIVRLRTLSLLLGNLKAGSVSNGKVRESNHITTWNNLEQLNQGGLAARSGTEFTWSPQLRNLAEGDWVPIFLRNKYGGECGHGKMMSFCSVLRFTASKHQEKVFVNFFHEILDIRRRDVWTVHEWLHSSWFFTLASSVIIFERPASG